nr:MBL fold metallo-hydrolase [uncultured Niameybacter sp.]
MLRFLGIGSAFNTGLGNNSAYIKEEQSMLLVDCGGTVFHAIQKRRLLEDLKDLTIIITHTHPDHVGSLGEVIFYCYYILKMRPVIIFPNATLIETYLQVTGVTKEMYIIKSKGNVEFDRNPLGIYKIEWHQHSHVDTIPAYGFIMYTEKLNFYYSGDSNELPKHIIDKLEVGKINRIYQDTCGLEYENNAHLFLGELSKLIKPVFREKVYCMHLDKHINSKEIKKFGFNKVERI